MKHFPIISNTIVILLLFVSCNSEERSWNRAKNVNTIEQYKKFIKEFPKGEYSSLAHANIVDLEWEILKKSDSLELFIKFEEDYKNTSLSDTIAVLAQIAAIKSFENAVKQGDKGRIERIVDYSPDIVENNQLLLSSYITSVEDCNSDLVEFFMQFWGNPTGYTHVGTTPLHHAAKVGCIEVMDLLMKRGAEIDVLVHERLQGWQRQGNTVRSFGFANTPELYGSPLHWAAKYGQIDAARFLVDRGGDVNQYTYRERSILTLACESGNFELVDFLISKGGVIPIDIGENTHLIHHAKTGEIAKLLVENGAKIDYYAKNIGLPIHYASYRGFYDAIDFYISMGTDVNKEVEIYVRPINGIQKVIPIWIAAYRGNLETIKFLESNGGNLNYVSHSSDFTGTLLHAAAISGDAATMKYLVSKIKNIEPKTNFQKEVIAYTILTEVGKKWKNLTPLALATYLSNFDVIKVLVAAGANINYKNPQNWTILDFAVIYSGNEQIVAYLLEHGAIITNQTKDAIDKNIIPEGIKKVLTNNLSNAN